MFKYCITCSTIHYLFYVAARVILGAPEGINLKYTTWLLLFNLKQKLNHDHDDISFLQKNIM